MNGNRQEKQFGLWTSPLKASNLASELRFSDVLWDSEGESIIWREERSDQGVLVRAAHGGSPNDLTENLSVRARVGYGGGDFTVSSGDAYFVADGQLFRQPFTDSTAQSITPGWGNCASPSVSPDGKYVLYVHSDGKVDLLALVDSGGQHWPVKLAEDHDFYMQPCWHPQGKQVAWIAWDHPNMPWDGTALFVGDLSAASPLPQLSNPRVVAGDPGGNCAIFQPAFSPDGRYLSYVSNESGWFNLHLLDLTSDQSQHLVQDEAEHALPAWIQGLRTYGWTTDSTALYFLRLEQGFTSLVRFDLRTRTPEPIQGKLQDFASLKQIAISPTEEKVALIASSPRTESRILSVSRDGEVWTHRRSSPDTISAGYLSQPRSLKWTVDTNFPVNCCYGLYYLPTNADFESVDLPPAIIKIHGGPTSQFEANYHSDTQFFTSRGFAVLELNYRGSSGYGKAYTDALKGNWGVTEVEDTHSAARHLVSEGLADPNRLVLMGGSAGGYTVLLCLIAYPGFFRAGICRYAVTNLFTLADITHKFEERYLDFLVGTLPEHEKRYRVRSPVFRADCIQDPVAIFQGEEDQVVPKAQAEEIVDNLARRKVPHFYRLFEGEGHGWRKSDTIQSYYDEAEAFLLRYVLS